MGIEFSLAYKARNGAAGGSESEEKAMIAVV